MQDWPGVSTLTSWVVSWLPSKIPSAMRHGKPPDLIKSTRADSGASQVPIEVPPIVDIKKALPHHCFKPSLFRSFSYVAKDLLLILGLYLGVLILERQPYPTAYHALLPVYWFLQGTMFWALFVLGHDCGHSSFSSSNILNDITGTLLHSFILVPFYPWKLSHKSHHKNTGNIDKEEIFYPIREKDFQKDFTPVQPVFGFGVSWFAYLLTGYYPRTKCHFNIFEELFQGHVLGCLLSIVSVVVWLACLLLYGHIYGYITLVNHYGAPLFIFASWLVLVTFLHHNDTGVPWYADSVWNNVRGQLSTIDRHYGWAHGLTHNIGTHQVHHLFTKIPHYHLEEATAHFRESFPHLVRISHEPILSSMFRVFDVFIRQRHIADGTTVHVYKDS